MKTHKLKILPKYMSAQLSGVKTFEIRKNDRNYQVGDRLLLREWDGEKYTGRETMVFITYITDYKQKNGYVVLATNAFWPLDV
ncbi:ASCH/PUA domain-containing protein [Levilactobacillus brevis]|uniref:ASCH/PUA domain-containing protein n=1 Tax=Levilactobacillus brevis TaxID=1580 RepID=UPI0031D0FD5A